MVSLSAGIKKSQTQSIIRTTLRTEQKSECLGLLYTAVELLKPTCGLLQDLRYDSFVTIMY